MKTITYNLNGEKKDAVKYYKEVSKFSKKFLEYIYNKNLKIIDEYSEFINEKVKRSEEEYILEFLTIGILWKNYINYAINLKESNYRILRDLYRLRKDEKAVKKEVDDLRGILITKFLLIDQKNDLEIKYNLKFLRKLIKWLEASGDFSEEVERIKNWEKFLKTKNKNEINLVLNNAIEISEYFETESKKVFKKYMGNLEDFLKNQKNIYKNKEDIIFTGKRENEYYLNMVGPEIINQVFRKRFLSTKEKIALLPTCMCYDSSKCKAKKNGIDITCVECNEACNIGKINKLGREKGFKVYLVPHSSDFSKWLKKWENQNETGLIGVACLLNLMLGGYEMASLNIPSQCVFLDYCGCQKHWSFEKEIPTNICSQKLLEIIEKS